MSQCIRFPKNFVCPYRGKAYVINLISSYDLFRTKLPCKFTCQKGVCGDSLATKAHGLKGVQMFFITTEADSP